MMEKLTDTERRVWSLAVLDLSAVIGFVSRRGRETERWRQRGEVHGSHFPQLGQDPVDIESLPKRGHGWLATA